MIEILKVEVGKVPNYACIKNQVEVLKGLVVEEMEFALPDGIYQLYGDNVVMVYNLKGKQYGPESNRRHWDGKELIDVLERMWDSLANGEIIVIIKLGIKGVAV